MANEKTSSPRRGWRAFVWRHPFAGAALLLVVALVLGLPMLAPLGAAWVLGDALGAPVTIGAVWWNPFSGQATARGVSIGNGEGRMTAQRVSAVVNPMRLWRARDIVIERVELDAPVASVSIDEQNHVTVDALGKGSAPTNATTHVVVRDLDVTDGDLVVRHPVAGTIRTSVVRLTRLNAPEVDFESTPSRARLQMSGRFEGSVDSAPIEGDIRVLLAGDETQITGTLGVSGLTVNRDVTPLPQAFENFAAALDARATLDLKGQPLGGTVRLDMSLASPRFKGPEGSELSASKASFHDMQVDLSSRGVALGAVTLEAPALVATVTAGGIVMPLSSTAGEGGQAWAISSGAVEMRGGRIAARRGDTTVAVALDSVHWDGLRHGRPSAFTATARAESGGRLTVDGTLDAAPFAAKLDLRFEGLSLPPLSQFAAEVPLRLAKGTASGSLQVDYRGGLRRIEGKLQAHDVQTAPPAANRPSEVMALDSADLEVSIDTTPVLVVDVSRLKLSYPYVMVQRRTAGVFPYSLLASSRAASMPPAASAAHARLPIRIRRVAIDGGKIELLDTTQEPPYWTSLTGVSAEAEEVLLGDGTVTRFKATAKQDEISPAEISGSLSADGLVAHVVVRDVLLESINTYVSPVLGYNFTAGRVSVTATATPAPPVLESTAEFILQGVGVLQTGLDVIQQQSGVPLPIALGLIADPSGEIRMTVPLSVDLKSRSLEVGSVIWQGVRRAIVGALTSPLRLLGSLFGTRGAPYAFAIDPIPFRSGRGSLDDAGAARIAEIARILEAHRSLVLVLMPQVTEEDLREVGPEKATKLAEMRNAAVRDAFIDGAHLAPDRILLVDWKPATRAEATDRSGVYVELQDGS